MKNLLERANSVLVEKLTALRKIDKMPKSAKPAAYSSQGLVIFFTSKQVFVSDDDGIIYKGIL